MPIKELDKQTAEQIAAGEVIENPASVIKELVENALDAGATIIEVEIEGGGKKRITVTDNGCGINASEIPLAFKRFATSKLAVISDLDCLNSLGFRGEALPSIAAVAKVKLISRTGNSLSGLEINLAGGEVVGKKEVGTPPGTRVEVTDLFFNTPGRLKFLRADSVESTRVSLLLTEMALARPAVAFKLSSGKRTLLSSSGDGELLHVIGALYGNETAEAMLKLNRSDHKTGYSLEGFLSAPHLTRSSRRWITLVINGRLIKNPLLVNALERGYGDLLPRQRHPVSVLHLTIPPHTIDVNVHPAKVEIRFQDPETAKNLIYRSVKTSLQSDYNAPQWPDSGFENSFNGHPGKTLNQNRYLPDEWKESRILENSAPFTPGTLRSDDSFRPATEILSDKPAQGTCHLIGQYLQSYLVVQKDENLLLIDQHAAHERILYHKLMKSSEADRQENRDRLESQLTIPLTLDFPSAWRDRVDDLLPLLQQSGFNLEPLGEDSYVIRSVPFLLRSEFSAAIVYDLVEKLLTAGYNCLEEKLDAINKTIACHRSIKAKQPLTRNEMEQLLQEWQNTPHSQFCPHGRPTVISFDRNQLEKSFHRKGT